MATKPIMTSMLLVFLMATVAVSSVAASGYPSNSGEQQLQYPSTGTSPSNEKVSKFKEILGGDICKSALRVVDKAKNKCCNDLGNRGKCICPTVRSIVDSITFVQGLCDNYNACKGSWNYEVPECNNLLDEYKENKAGECNEALMELKKMHKDCLDKLAFPGKY